MNPLLIDRHPVRVGDPGHDTEQLRPWFRSTASSTEQDPAKRSTAEKEVTCSFLIFSENEL